MDRSILDFLKTQRVGVLAVEMMDGSPHAATVHFAHQENPLLFLFETFRSYRKAQPLLAKPEVRATLVIGTSEEVMQTFQLDGTVRLLQEDQQSLYEKVYLGKFPEKKEKSKDPQFIRFVFIPTWWRFTDWNTPEGKKILTSE